MNVSLEVLGGVVAILVSLSGIYFGQRKITLIAKEAAEKSQLEHRKAQIDSEGRFRDQLITRENLLAERIAKQDQQIATLNELVVSLQKRLDAESNDHNEARKHRELCEKKLAKIERELEALKK